MFKCFSLLRGFEVVRKKHSAEPSTYSWFLKLKLSFGDVPNGVAGELMLTLNCAGKKRTNTNNSARFRRARGLSKLELNGQKGTVLLLDPSQAQLGRLPVMLHNGKRPEENRGTKT